MPKCLKCNKKIKNKKFCDSSCAAKHNNRNRIFNPKNDKRTKILNCSVCEKKIEVNIRACKRVKCESCKRKKCKICGDKKCKNLYICKKLKSGKFKNLILFGFDKNKVGTIEVYDEFFKMIHSLNKEYHENKLSLEELCEKYKYNFGASNLWNILKRLDFTFRTVSQGTTNAILKGRFSPPSSRRYKHGWHISWNGKKVYYRSSYELEYALKLDNEKIDYEMESKRILYWDSQEQKERVAIPDFYLPKNNIIIEIKSSYTYNKQNMIDKVRSYKENGYNFKLILDKEENCSI